MSHPHTLSSVAERIRGGTAEAVAIPEFLDAFYFCQDGTARAAMLREEPALSGSARLDALLAAICHYLSKQHRVPGPMPGWVSSPARVLAEPWWTTTVDDDGMREYLTYASPAEFTSHRIFTEARPLRRASLRQVD